MVNEERRFVLQLQSLAQDTGRRTRLGAAGRKACVEVYNSQHTAQAYDALFRQLLGGIPESGAQPSLSPEAR